MRGEDFFNLLPEEVQIKYMNNIRNNFWKNCTYESFYNFISSSFIWSATEEGHDYWHRVARRDFRVNNAVTTVIRPKKIKVFRNLLNMVYK